MGAAESMWNCWATFWLSLRVCVWKVTPYFIKIAFDSFCTCTAKRRAGAGRGCPLATLGGMRIKARMWSHCRAWARSYNVSCTTFCFWKFQLHHSPFFPLPSGVDRTRTVRDIRPGTNRIDMNSTQTTCSLLISNLCFSKEIKDIIYFLKQLKRPFVSI